MVSSLDYGRTAGNAALVGRNHIVVASDAMNSAYVQAGVHELVHNLRRESSAYYDAFSSVVLDTLKKDGGFDLQAAIAERIRQYAEQGQQLSEADALEEIVAEAAPAALTNKDAMRAFVKENRSLAEKVRDFFVRFADELREIAAKYGVGNSREEVNAMLRAEAQDLVNIAEVLDMALSAAQESATVERATTGIELQELEKYSLKDRNVIEGYLDAVDQEVLEAAQTYRADKNAKFRRIKLGDVQQREAEAIKSLTGKDVSGYTHNIDRNGFVHIENRHGINGAQDQSMSDLNDVARQGWVIENYDDIGRLKGRDGKYVDSYGYLGTNGEPSPVVVYRKRINGTYYLVEAVADGRWKKLWTVSAYISDKKIDASWTSNASFETPNFTSETGSTAASADIVTESGENVNPSTGISSEAREETKFSLKDSEAFKKWFGDSKVVDKKGNPLVVYHATNSEFNVFDRRKLGDFTSGNTDWQPAVRSAQIGFWFSDRDLAATIFTDGNRRRPSICRCRSPIGRSSNRSGTRWSIPGRRRMSKDCRSAATTACACRTANSDIRFSLKSPVEESRNLPSPARGTWIEYMDSTVRKETIVYACLQFAHKIDALSVGTPCKEGVLYGAGSFRGAGSGTGAGFARAGRSRRVREVEKASCTPARLPRERTVGRSLAH